MLKFNRKYFAITIFIFIVEVLIAIFVHDHFFRPYFGDFLVVILIYCFLKSFVNLSVLTASFIVLLFSFFVEFLQYLNLVEKLGLSKSKIAKIVIGTSFSWIDLITYTAGIFCVIMIESLISKRSVK